jgi:hypothetical protein
VRVASKPFLTDDRDLLWLSLLQRDTGIPAADWLGIKDGVLRLEFSLAVTHRLLRFDNEKDEGNRKFWMQLVGAGEEAAPEGDPSIDDATEVW